MNILLVEFSAISLILISVGASTVAGIGVAVVRWLFKIHAEFRELQQKVAYLWPIAKRDSTEELHHSDQPVFDALLDKYKAGTLTEAERDQLIERASKIASGEADKPDQVLAAKLILHDAETEKARLASKTGTTAEPGSLSEGAQNAVNREAGKAMAAEGAASDEPERGDEKDR